MPNHNFYKIKFRKLDEYLELHDKDTEKLLTKAAKQYLDEKPFSSYSKILQKYNFNIRSDMLSFMIKKLKLKRGLLLPCIFCDKGNVGNDFCRFCLGIGLISKEDVKQFKRKVNEIAALQI